MAGDDKFRRLFVRECQEIDDRRVGADYQAFRNGTNSVPIG